MLATFLIVCGAIGLWLIIPRLLRLRRPKQQRSYPSFIAGLRYSAPDGLDRGRYCAGLKPGTILDLVPEPDNPHDPFAVSLRHNGHHVGFIPAKHGWVSKSLAEGDTLNCVVTESELEDGRAAFVGLEIGVIADDQKRKIHKGKV